MAKRDYYEVLGVSRDAVMALGDNASDIAMFEQAAIGVAMGNATEAVRRSADAVAPSNDDGGVAWAVRTLTPPPA